MRVPFFNVKTFKSHVGSGILLEYVNHTHFEVWAERKLESQTHTEKKDG